MVGFTCDPLEGGEEEKRKREISELAEIEGTSPRTGGFALVLYKIYGFAPICGPYRTFFRFCLVVRLLSVAVIRLHGLRYRARACSV